MKASCLVYKVLTPVRAPLIDTFSDEEMKRIVEKRYGKEVAEHLDYMFERRPFNGKMMVYYPPTTFYGAVKRAMKDAGLDSDKLAVKRLRALARTSLGVFCDDRAVVRKQSMYIDEDGDKKPTLVIYEYLPQGTECLVATLLPPAALKNIVDGLLPALRMITIGGWREKGFGKLVFVGIRECEVTIQ